jgi:hypothetical protein
MRREVGEKETESSKKKQQEGRGRENRKCFWLERLVGPRKPQSEALGLCRYTAAATAMKTDQRVVPKE